MERLEVLVEQLTAGAFQRYQNNLPSGVHCTCCDKISDARGRVCRRVESVQRLNHKELGQNRVKGRGGEIVEKHEQVVNKERKERKEGGGGEEEAEHGQVSEKG